MSPSVCRGCGTEAVDAVAAGDTHPPLPPAVCGTAELQVATTARGVQPSTQCFAEWANARILDTAGGLAPEQLRTPGIASFGAVHETLVHTMSAQEMWLSRWRHGAPAAMLDPAGYPDLAALRAQWGAIERDTQSFVAALGIDEEHDPARVVTYTNTRGQTWAKPLWQLMLQQVNHATQHRSEVAAMLTHLGHSPGWLDLVIFLDAPGSADSS